MQKHYKLVAGLLALILGTGLEAAELTTRGAVDLLRYALRDYAQDLPAGNICVGDQHSSLNEARKSIFFKAVKRLSENLSGAMALSLADTPSIDLACQTAQRMEIGLAGDEERIDAEVAELIHRGLSFDPVVMTPEDVFEMKAKFDSDGLSAFIHRLPSREPEANLVFDGPTGFIFWFKT